ncbi:Predicted phage recombinase, RecA/RadA family [Halopseudomonas litoralis]|uniref:Predicted phage recombinase, RecA/RadA family n=1 Tax=Halopseudomonas litoralis TaxID=797277 RepID=A0A1H1QSE3_9GAMM|nr:capsid cement protein [Halopseudomonas litoralis]SDS26233.1 Predicted phage recombinase, RecA/RadA family [Halopseudomonas litoralis]
MAKNYIQDGSVLTLIAPAGGVKSGGIYAIGTLVVVAVADAAAGESFAGHPGGVWSVPAASGLTAGAAVGLADGGLVAAATEGAVACGKLVTDEAGGTANLLLIN